MDLASTAFSSPSVKSVPTRRPSRPREQSRLPAQSLAQERPDRIQLLRRECSQTSIALLAAGRHQVVTTDPVTDSIMQFPLAPWFLLHFLPTMRPGTL